MSRDPSFAFENSLERRSSETGTVGAELLAAATPRLYLDHPFRRLGLPVLSTSREISRRIDELKLSIELGTSSTPWAFALETEMTINEIRAAAQKLKSPRERLLYEFFWFWPENYPFEGNDEALDVLAMGETAPAVDTWLRAAEAGSRVARHNLAVYHHLLVLDWERLPEHEETRLEAVWPQTLEYWLNIADDEPLWELLRTRVEQIGDPQLPSGFVAELRAALPSAVSKINATLLIDDAAQGRTARVALHASLIALIHRDATGVRRTLEDSAAPLTRQLDGYVAAARRAVHDESAPALATALTLAHNCDGDLRLVATLCGREEVYTELSSSVADAALACLVAHQRRTKDDASCLPLLVYLLNMAVTPELRQRLEETYQVIRANLFAATDPSAAAEDSAHALEHDLIAEKIVPFLDTLQLNAIGRLEFTTRLAEWLGQLADAARHELPRSDLAQRILSTALALPCEPALRRRLEDQFAQVARERRHRENAVHLKCGGHTVIVDATQLTLDANIFSPLEITGLRYGPTAEGGWVVGWCSSERAVALDAANVFTGENAAGDFADVVAALQTFVAPELVGRLSAAIREDSVVTVGQLSLHRQGLALDSGDLARDETWIPYTRLQHRVHDGVVTISDPNQPSLAPSCALAEVWNAALVGSVIDALAGDADSPPF